MPKRPAPTATAMSADIQAPPAKVQKTERSHEENQERAYIAASRRADRSLEARVQSAKMASEIHRRRTGRGLKVSEEIVLKEEMYEEEEDDLPRSYRQLTAHLQTNSSEMNSRFSAYVSTQTALATMQRYNEVNRLFRDAFSPTAVAYQQQINNSVYMAPLFNNGMPSPSGNRDSVSAAQPQYDGGNRKPTANTPQRTDSTTTAAPISTPPAAASPASTALNTPDIKGKSAFHMPEAGLSNLPLDPQLRQQPSSSFTSELPNQIKMLGNFDMNDPMGLHFFGEATPALHMLHEQGDMPPWDQVHTGLTELRSPANQHHQDDQLYFSPCTNSADDFDHSLPSEAFGNHDLAAEETDWDTWLNLDSSAAVPS
ncbi:hypothetical protein F5Y18DRAFT_76268 [Xylariaceae sp. FL1019]|nr:hypothetical protein F5Y18DRAFT_76268 [Xylariaceae sp. FL1019]